MSKKGSCSFFFFILSKNRLFQITSWKSNKPIDQIVLVITAKQPFNLRVYFTSSVLIRLWKSGQFATKTRDLSKCFYRKITAGQRPNHVFLPRTRANPIVVKSTGSWTEGDCGSLVPVDLAFLIQRKARIKICLKLLVFSWWIPTSNRWVWVCFIQKQILPVWSTVWNKGKLNRTVGND